MKRPLQLLLLTCFALLLACRKDVKSETVVYINNFENADLNHITGGAIELFNGTHVLGRYNNGSFMLSLSNLPKHDLVKIGFDLYIHDGWDGSQSFADNAIGPDIWQMIVSGTTYINTTFSNAQCAPGNTCPSQAYPGDYPSNNSPRTGATNLQLPGACVNQSEFNGTTLYKIEKTIHATSANVTIQCLDHLIDKNVSDPKCNESWSIDNLKVTAVAL